MGDAWRLALGTLTAIRVPAPRRVDRAVAGRAMLLGPLAALPLGLLVAGVCWGGRELGADALAVALVAVGALALGSRALHLDGLSDVADGLTASHDAQRSLDVMKTGTAGPAGAAALVVLLGTQAAALATVLCLAWGPLLAGTIVAASRGTLALACLRGVPAARADGLAVHYAGTVGRTAAGAVWALLALALVGAGALTGQGWQHGLVVAASGLLAGAAVVAHCVRRLGGVTGDVFGAAIEVSLAAMLVAATAGVFR